MRSYEPGNKSKFTLAASLMPKSNHYPDRGEEPFDLERSEVCIWLMELIDEEWFPKWLFSQAVNRGAIVFDGVTQCWYGTETEDGQRILRDKGRSLELPSENRPMGAPKLYEIDSILAILGENRLKSGEWKARSERQLGLSKATFDRAVRQLVKEGRIVKDRVDMKWHSVSKARSQEDDTAKVTGSPKETPINTPENGVLQQAFDAGVAKAEAAIDWGIDGGAQEAK